MYNRGWLVCAVALGFALGGFFDGILLHQILQWHHLLSLVPGASDLRLQILWDGMFHAVMYLIAAISLCGLWRLRERAERGVLTTGAILIGIGAWHIADAFLSHWVLGIHRIKPDSAVPLAWDLLWLFAFGIAPVLAGIFLRSGPPSDRGLSRATMASITLLTGLAGIWALQPPIADGPSTVVFAPWISTEAAERALSDAQVQLIWGTDDGRVALIDMPRAQRWSLYASGALFVSGAGLPDGCFSWSRQG